MATRGHHTPPLLRGSGPVRALAMLVGFALIAAGIVAMLRAEAGLGPWDVLHQGLADRTPLGFGTANVAVGITVVALIALLGSRREIGWATLANMALIGVFIDLLLVPDPLASLGEQGYAVRLMAAAAGTLVAGAGFALYIAAGFGAGPRDALMLILARRARTRIALARTALELTVLALGLLLGGTAGLGTLVFALGVGPAMELALAAYAWAGVATPAPALPAVSPR